MKSITIMGMSGVGKTTLASKLDKNNWFHYSADYRIASHYLKNDIEQFLEKEASKSLVIKDLLQSNSVKIKSNLSIDNLLPVSAYIGKLGCNELSGLDLDTFTKRQDLHYQAEIKATYDIKEFQQKAKTLGFNYFLHDSGGSLCELYQSKGLMDFLAKQTKIIYIHADNNLVKEITDRALKYPKPLYYDRKFLLTQLSNYKKNTGQEINKTKPNDLIRFIIPNLMKHREKLYLEIANKYGLIINANDILKLRDEKDFLEIIKER